MGLIRADLALFRFRLEKAITDLKPPKINIDPTTNFWTTYKKVADEHDNDLVSQYVGDLDTSLLFVSALTPAARLISLNQVLPSVLGGFILGRCCLRHCPNHPTDPARPRRPDERPAASNITTEHLVWWG